MLWMWLCVLAVMLGMGCGAWNPGWSGANVGSWCGVLWVQVAAHVPTRSKVECVNHFIQLPFGDNYCVEPEEPKAGVVGGGETAKKTAGTGEGGGLSGRTVSNGAVPAVSRRDAAADGGGEGVGGGDDVVSPFTDTSHPLFSQVRMRACKGWSSFM